MVNLLFGEYGSGKSTYILNQIEADYKAGVRSFLIVPEQETVICERKVASLLPPRAQLYTEVINFTRLANKVFREYGGLKYNYVTKSGKNLIMYRAICECRDILTEYEVKSGHEKGLISVFLEAIGELKTYSNDIQKLKGIVDEIENPRLRGRISDIIAVWSAYERIMSERFSDPYDDIFILGQKLDKHDYFNGVNVYFDSFYDFTKSQLSVIEKIIRTAKNVTFAFDCPKNAKPSSIQYAKIAKSAEIIKGMCKPSANIISFENDYKHENKSLAHICSSLWNFSAPKIDDKSGITLALCANEFSECEYVASKICELIYAGNKYSDIAVIARDINTYRGILDFTFKKFNIPHFLSTQDELLTKPLVKMIFSALNAISSYKATDIISYIKCGYLDIDKGALGDFENYITRWNIYGKKFRNDDYWASNPDGYVKEFSKEQENALVRVHSVKDTVLRMLDILEAPFIKGASVKECASAVYSFLCAHRVIDKLEEEKKNASRDEAYVIVQVWQSILDALDTVCDICGDEVVTAQTFASLLHYALIDTSVGSIPTGEDNVLIADATLVRAQSIKHVFVLGANEGEFPQEIKNSSFFSDSDKIALETHDIFLSEKTDVRSDDELMFFKHAIAIASHGATVTTLKAGIDGSKKAPSIAFNRIKALFNDISVLDVSNNGIIDKLYTKELANEYYGSSSEELKLAIAKTTSVKNTELRDFSNDRDSISEKSAKELYGKHLSLTQSRIEAFQKCRLSYYCKYHLKLNSSNKISFSSLDVGNLVHSVFEHFLKMITSHKDGFVSLTSEQIKKTVDEIVDDYILAICKYSVVSNRLKHLFDRLRSNLYVYVKRLVEEFKQSDFVPEFFELSFYGGSDNPQPLELKLKNGTVVTVYGVADRVDTYRNKDATYIRIVDYKTGDKTFSMKDVENGIGLQLLIYLFALCKMKDCDFKKKLLKDTTKVMPAGVFYMPLNLGKASIDSDFVFDPEKSEELEEMAINEKIKPSGRFLDDEEIICAQDKSEEKSFLPSRNGKGRTSSYLSSEGFDELYEGITSLIGDISAAIISGEASAVPLDEGNNKSACDYCENKPFCRRREL